ncbi:hypothetical protein RB628_04655 [Streptomyces sp. ADMS]|uniref:hypothetical protein n=1 Tax=Streptomyces sp. ADMS TaxID=3071415 RepID=UPI00296FC4C4|nr:hypothetical protein [Streptomyces sp. ADMS]MDW4904652.1 hypothetical protein [Streptomyces sp. ADMS]
MPTQCLVSVDCSPGRVRRERSPLPRWRGTRGRKPFRSRVDGWVVPCRAAQLLVEPWGHTIDAGTAEHVTRHALDAVIDEEAVTWAGGGLKVFDDPATVGADSARAGGPASGPAACCRPG